ncbi:MAG: Gfo/Idh/MocA family protein, partial [Planctomycetaceae bacterium]
MSHSAVSSRRQFLQQSGSVLAAAAAAPAVLTAAVLRRQLNVAAIGVNGMGWADLSNIGSHSAVKFVGFCDIDASRFDKADAAFPGVRHWADYRELLADLAGGVDAVIVSTPDHMHAPVAMAAMRAGKHVYCRKPLTHTVWEARQLRTQAEKSGVTTQMGNQIHSAAEYRLGVRLIREGAIGK